uniref:Secreted protein n=1 Tax=Macrostomum lignano TaxID=282301 RepID=A0A1I8FCQ8_9PLAT
MVAWMCRLSAALPTCSYGAPVCGFCSRRQYGSSACTLSRPTASPTLLAAGPDPSGGSGGYQQKGGVETGAGSATSVALPPSLCGWRLA